MLPAEQLLTTCRQRMQQVLLSCWQLVTACVLVSHCFLVGKWLLRPDALSCLLQAESVAERSKALNKAFTYALFINVCRSLFEAHKLMFPFLLAIKILQNRKEIDPGGTPNQTLL